MISDVYLLEVFSGYNLWSGLARICLALFLSNYGSHVICASRVIILNCVGG